MVVSYKFLSLKTSKRLNYFETRVGLVTLNRPKALNALCGPLMDDLLVRTNEFLFYRVQKMIGLNVSYSQHNIWRRHLKNK
jgi:hypothetical protein